MTLFHLKFNQISYCDTPTYIAIYAYYSDLFSYWCSSLLKLFAHLNLYVEKVIFAQIVGVVNSDILAKTILISLIIVIILVYKNIYDS